MTLICGWLSLVLLIFGFHRWAVVGVFTDRLVQIGIILGFGLAVMWAWGYADQIRDRVTAWKRNGGVNSAMVAIGLVAALIVANTLIRRRVEVKFDLTKNQRYTLSPRSKEILRGLTQPVEVTYYAPSDHRDLDRTRDLLAQYADVSDRFRWRYVNPLVNLTELLSQNVKVNQDLTAIRVKYGQKTQDLTSFTEKDITGGILKLVDPKERKVLFLTGHGELAPEGTNPQETLRALKQDLEEVRWTTDTLNLFEKDAKAPDPDTVAAVVIAGPRRDLADQEKKLLTEYLNKGGSLLLLIGPGNPSFSEFLKPWGIQTTNDVVLDLRQQQGIVVINRPEDHPAVKSLARVICGPMRSVRAASNPPQGITITEVLKTGPEATTIPNYTPGRPLDPSSGTEGAVPVAAIAEKTIGTGDTAKKARVAVVGDALFASDLLTQQFAAVGDNLGLASGLTSYVGEEEALVSIPPKDEETEQAFLEPAQARLLVLLHYIDFPLLALVLAVFVYLKRR